jgi:hypothetical protein
MPLRVICSLPARHGSCHGPRHGFDDSGRHANQRGQAERLDARDSGRPRLNRAVHGFQGQERCSTVRRFEVGERQEELQEREGAEAPRMPGSDQATRVRLVASPIASPLATTVSGVTGDSVGRSGARRCSGVIDQGRCSLFTRTSICPNRSLLSTLLIGSVQAAACRSRRSPPSAARRGALRALGPAPPGSASQPRRA